MKSRLSLIFAALVVLLGSMVWLVRDRNAVLASAPAMAVDRLPSISYQPVPVSITETPPIPIVAAEAPIAQVKSSPMVRIDESGAAKYVARNGDTVSQLAIALLGSDSKENRDEVIAANPVLKSNPDRVLEGDTYSMGATAPTNDDRAIAHPAAVAIPVQAPTQAPTPAPAPAIIAPASKMTYVAQAGDSVALLAAHFLGGDTKANRDAIIAQNASLRQHPDQLMAGQTYTIVAADGLVAADDAPQDKSPTTQPDADDAAKLSVGRTLRYTAKVGDTVSKLAEALLGDDTPANREMIIRSNPSLKQNPDRLVAGQTYWIAAPTADSNR